ncbi:MAG: hypothetical protein HOQ20_15805 [Bradyrhizobium sp.]|nr:hypothetical protein [Bradyrhizobium sp.]
MRNFVTAIALVGALPAAVHAAPTAKADDGKAKDTTCMSHMQGHDMSKMDMKGHDMAGMTMPGHDTTKMQSCAEAAQKGASSSPDAHPTHAR